MRKCEIRVELDRQSSFYSIILPLKSLSVYLFVFSLRLTMKRALWVLSSHPQSPTAAWRRSSACQSKSSCFAPCLRGSRYICLCVCVCLRDAPLTSPPLIVGYRVQRIMQYIHVLLSELCFSVSTQIDVHITPGSHASEEAGNEKHQVEVVRRCCDCM